MPMNYDFSTVSEGQRTGGQGRNLGGGDTLEGAIFESDVEFGSKF